MIGLLNEPLLGPFVFGDIREVQVEQVVIGQRMDLTRQIPPTRMIFEAIRSQTRALQSD